MTVDLARLVEALHKFAAAAELREAEYYALVRRIDDTTRKLAARGGGELDTNALADAIANEIILGWQRSKFADPWNWLTTEGRKNVALCIENFLIDQR